LVIDIPDGPDVNFMTPFYITLEESRQTPIARWHPSGGGFIPMDENNPISVVENLIETCKDGQKGYLDAAQHVKRSDLKTYFNEQSLERGRFAGELHTVLATLGKPEKKVSGSVGAALHRAWIDTKVSLGGGDKTILESVEAGEDSAKEAYQKALSGTLPANVAEIVRRQATKVQQAHDKVKGLRDTAAAA
jgi:uncharacterized protein (TIGR02284 family)